MLVRVATFNVENLFQRPIAMNLPSWSAGQPILDSCNSLNNLLNKEIYTEQDKQTILNLLEDNDLLAVRPLKNKFLELKKIRGRLFRIPKKQPPEIVANGRSDWVGWVELKREAVEDQAIANTARIIADVNPDILVLVEVENRSTLQRFHDQVLLPQLQVRGHERYDHNMIIDGNDPRDIDVGIMSRFPITHIRSHITDRENGKPIFSRDCPEYLLSLGQGNELVILPNHFSSKGSDLRGNRRRVQAKKAKDIYEKLKADHQHIIIAGDLNDHPAGGSLDMLLQESDLMDAMSLPAYQGFPGTYKHANAKEKLDYLLLSPSLARSVDLVDVDRRGFYAPRKWKSLESITKDTKDRFQASDHHCLYADIEI
jgi:endonuclease/exonuclease/phosphatase family metal-dependent hydrolase